MSGKGAGIYRATAVVDFPRVARFLDPILTAITTHDMTLEAKGDSIKSCPHSGVDGCGRQWGNCILWSKPAAFQISTG